MSKKEFLDGLQRALAGEVSEYEIRSNVDYYNNYIIDAMRSGRTEADVLQELGDPSLIAKTIIETSGMQNENGNADAYYAEDSHEEKDKKKGFNADYDEDGGLNIRYGRFKLNSWYAKLVMVLIVLLAVFLVISLVVSVMSVLIPIILPVLVILVVLSVLNGNRRR